MTAQTSVAPEARSVATPYPRKYWWVVLFVLPVVVGSIAIVPELLRKSGGGNSISIGDSTINGDVQIGDNLITTQVIIQQIKNDSSGTPDVESIEKSVRRANNLAEGGFKKDAIALYEEVVKKAQAPALYNNLGMLYLLENQPEKAHEAFKEGIAINPDYQPLRLNLGRAYEKEGKFKEAISQLEKVSDKREAKILLKRLQEKKADGALEQEPNDTILTPIVIPLATEIHGSLAEITDNDFFYFVTPPHYRDIIKISLRNRSTELQPAMRVFDGEKSDITGWMSKGTHGADLTHSFSAKPETAYYIQLTSSWNKTSGPYTLIVEPARAYDAFEPNNSVFHAKSIPLGTSIDADLMDGPDSDFYKFKTSSRAKSVRIAVQNHSKLLQPALQMLDAEKSDISGWQSKGTAGADLEYSFEVKPDSVYYVHFTSSWNKSSGPYTLTVKEE